MIADIHTPYLLFVVEPHSCDLRSMLVRTSIIRSRKVWTTLTWYVKPHQYATPYSMVYNTDTAPGLSYRIIRVSHHGITLIRGFASYDGSRAVIW